MSSDQFISSQRKLFEADWRSRHKDTMYCESSWRGWIACAQSMRSDAQESSGSKPAADSSVPEHAAGALPATPKYDAWMERQKTGDWPKGIDRSWMFGSCGSYNEHQVTCEVIAELRNALFQAVVVEAKTEGAAR